MKAKVTPTSILPHQSLIVRLPFSLVREERSYDK
jgi:hypothetical protein